jgi:hypothetical protein
MALWGISTTTELSTNNYNIPKYLQNTDKNRTPHNCFADTRGWIQRHYKTQENSGISTRYYDEVLVAAAGIAGTGGYNVSTGSTNTGLGLATPSAVFFEDPNRASNISIGSGGTTGIGTGTTGYVHLCFNEIVFAGAGATISVNRSTGTPIIATASSITPGVTVGNWTYAYPTAGVGAVTNTGSPVLTTNYNGQISNRISFAFTVPNTGIGTVLSIDMSKGFVGVITDIYFAEGVTSSFASGIIYNIAGAGNTSGVGIGATTLTITA